MEDDNEEPEEDTETPDCVKRVLEAAEGGHLDRLNALLKRDPDLVNGRDCDGYSPLHRASYNDHLDVVKHLLDRGADVRAATNDLWQPLHCAVKWGHVGVAALLLDNGAQVNCTTRGGVTPLHLAAGSQSKRLVELILYHPETDTTLKDSSGDTAEAIARRSGPFHGLFRNMV